METGKKRNFSILSRFPGVAIHSLAGYICSLIRLELTLSLSVSELHGISLFKASLQAQVSAPYKVTIGV